MRILSVLNMPNYKCPILYSVQKKQSSSGAPELPPQCPPGKQCWKQLYLCTKILILIEAFPGSTRKYGHLESQVKIPMTVSPFLQFPSLLPSFSPSFALLVWLPLLTFPCHMIIPCLDDHLFGEMLAHQVFKSFICTCAEPYCYSW